MDNLINVKIDGRKVKVKKGRTVLEIAEEIGIDIPILCFHPDLSVKSNCRLCVVEIKGTDGLQTACSTVVQNGMDITTESLKINKTRKTNLEFIFSQHLEECPDCVWMSNCQLLKLAKRYSADITRFKDRKSKRPVLQFGPIVFDETKCIDCRNCVEVCPVNFLEIKNRGADTEITPSRNRQKDCIYCGQCITHCPVGAIESTGEFEGIEKPLKKENKYIVAQFAPSIRTTIGEEFGLPYGEVVTGKLVAGLKKLGFYKVFDTSVGADFTTIEEAQELAERILKQRNLPAFSSCCPSWVKFLEFYRPEFIKNLCTARSPQTILGGLIKTYWAEKEKINPENVIVVSIMPCVSKKYEINRPELAINGLKPVDFVLTTRELARLLKKNKIDFKNLPSESADAPFDSPSGAGVIYGASGGVFESTLRTAFKKIAGKDIPDFNVKEIRGQEGIKIKALKIGNRTIKTAVVSGIKNAEKMLNELKKNPKAFDAMEVMACPGGCIGGGGQPLPVSAEIRKSRAESLYKIDGEKPLRSAHENPIIQQIYKDYLTNRKNIHSICHTKFSPKKKCPINKLKNSLKTHA